VGCASHLFYYTFPWHPSRSRRRSSKKSNVTFIDYKQRVCVRWCTLLNLRKCAAIVVVGVWGMFGVVATAPGCLHVMKLVNCRVVCGPEWVRAGLTGDGDGDSASTGSASGNLSLADLQAIFSYYANFGRTSVMAHQNALVCWLHPRCTSHGNSRGCCQDSFMFMKLAKECPGLLDKRTLSRNDIDLIFTKSKPKTDRRLSFDNFLHALLMVGAKRYPELEPKSAHRQLVRNHLRPLLELSKTSDSSAELPAAFRRLYDVRK
jgi:hypothetical protein